MNSGDWLLGDVFLRVSRGPLAYSLHSHHFQNVYVVHHGATSSKPPLVGLSSLTDPQTALTDFQNVRGSDPTALPPFVANRSRLEQWTENARIATAVSVMGGFMLGGLLTVWLKVGRRSKRVTTRR